MGATGPLGPPAPPLIAQHGIEQVVGPLTLGPRALAEVTFPPHAQPFQHCDRRRVPYIAAGSDPVLAANIDQVVDQQPGSFGGIAPAG